MKERCFNENSTSYPYYGGRGITVCDRWMLFENFLADMGDRPSKAHSLERKKTNGNYEPDNCKWATYKEQNNNARFNHIITIHGEAMTLSQASERFNISYHVLQQRITKSKMDPELAVTKQVAYFEKPDPLKRMSKDRISVVFMMRSEGNNQRQIARELGVDPSVISRVLNKKRGYGLRA